MKPGYNDSDNEDSNDNSNHNETNKDTNVDDTNNIDDNNVDDDTNNDNNVVDNDKRSAAAKFLTTTAGNQAFRTIVLDFDSAQRLPEFLPGPIIRAYVEKRGLE